MIHPLLSGLGALISKNRLSILIYHQVVAQSDPMRPSEPDALTFRWHMKLLRQYFRPISLNEAIQRLQQGNLPSNAVCVTFDDGYTNNLEVAQPILAEFNIPATVYVATAFSQGQNMWNDRLIDLFAMPDLSKVNLAALEMEEVQLSDWDNRRNNAYALIPHIKYRDYQARKAIIDQLYSDNGINEAPPRMMRPKQIAELSNKGVDIGAHTADHPILQSQSVEEQKRQIAQSKTDLETWLGKAVTGFAYPNGKPGKDYGAVAVEHVKALGFEYAVTTHWGISTPQTNPLELNRFTPWDTSVGRFHMRLLKNQLGV